MSVRSFTLASFMAVAWAAAGCQATPTADQPSAHGTGTTAPIGTVKELMRGMVDPNSDALWNAVGTEQTKDGTIEKAPKTDEDWTRLEYNALALAEVAELLKTPGRRMSQPDEAHSKSQPDAPELTPIEMEAKVARDPAAWASKADVFQATAVKAMAAARAHDKDAILAVGSEIDSACESCHRVYWYPDEKIPSVAAK